MNAEVMTVELWTSDREKRIANYFAEHEAHLLRRTVVGGADPIDAMKWSKPGTGIYRIDYLCDGPRLFVTGDLYEAIYMAGAPINGGGLAWWAGCDIGYFASKCMASPSGRGFKTWNAEYAMLNLREQFDQEEYESDADDAEESHRERFEAEGGWQSLGSDADWSEWLAEFGSEVWDDWTEMFSVGRVIDDLCLAHLRGLQLACAKLGLEMVR